VPAASSAAVLGQFANAFVCRRESLWVGAVGWRGNPLLAGAVLVELCLLVEFVAVPPVADLLGQALPALLGWAVAAGAVPAVWLADTVHKRVRVRRSWPAPGWSASGADESPPLLTAPTDSARRSGGLSGCRIPEAADQDPCRRRRWRNLVTPRPGATAPKSTAPSATVASTPPRITSSILRPSTSTGSPSAPLVESWRSVPAAALAPGHIGGVWTGQKVIVHGPVSFSDGRWRSVGAAYEPAAGRWRSIPPAPYPVEPVDGGYRAV
jgi:hypothetical protein